MVEVLIKDHWNLYYPMASMKPATLRWQLCGATHRESLILDEQFIFILFVDLFCRYPLQRSIVERMNVDERLQPFWAGWSVGALQQYMPVRLSLLGGVLARAIWLSSICKQTSLISKWRSWMYNIWWTIQPWLICLRDCYARVTCW